MLSCCGLFQQAWELVFRLKTIEDIQKESRGSLSSLPVTGRETTRQWSPDTNFNAAVRQIEGASLDPAQPITEQENQQEVYCLPLEQVKYHASAVRAKKATLFVQDTSMSLKLFATLHATSPQEQFMHIMFDEQKKHVWEGKAGPGELPLVKLAVLWKSPAVRAVSQVLRMMSLQPAIMLKGYFGPIMCDDCTDILFHSFLESAASQWLRVVLPYLSYPWRLAWLLDPDDLEANSVSLLVTFLQCPACMLEIGASLGIQQMCLGHDRRLATSTVSALEKAAKDLLRQDSFFMELLLVFFTGRSTNVEVEDNFGRASSMRQFLRGKTHLASTMATKHFSAELHHQHRRAVSDVMQEATVKSEPNHSAVVIDDTTTLYLPEAKARNSYTQYVKQTFEEQPYLPNESKSERYQRLRKHIKDTFKNDDNAAKKYAEETSSLDRAVVADRKRLKKLEKNESTPPETVPAPNLSWQQALHALCDLNREDVATESAIVVGDEAKSLYSGHLGVADDQYAISPSKLDELRAAPGFVDEKDSEWRSKHDYISRRPLGELTKLPDPQCIKYGQCVCNYSQAQKDSLQRMEDMFENIARIKKDWQSKTPTVMLLRLSRSDPSSASSSTGLSSSSTSPPAAKTYLKAYTIVNVTFLPLEFCVWQGSLRFKDGESVATGFDVSMLMESVRVPRQVQAAADVPADLRLPVMSKMRHAAAEIAGNGFFCVAVSLIFKGEYRVVDLCTVEVVKAPLFVACSEALGTWKKNKKEDLLLDDECKQLSAALKAMTAGLHPSKSKSNTATRRPTVSKTIKKSKPSATTSASAMTKSKAKATARRTRRSDGESGDDAESDAVRGSDDEYDYRGDEGSDCDDGRMEVYQEWMGCLDSEDPVLDLSGRLPSNFQELEESELTFIDPDDGKIYDVESGKLLGKISERLSAYKGDQPVVTVNCSLHAQCSTMKDAKSLRWGASARYRAWLRAGLRFPGRDQAAAHKRELRRFE